MQFSYNQYKEIVRCVKPFLKDFSVQKFDDSAVFIRHDVEFSIQRALDLSNLENKLGISTTYLFQIFNAAYNLFTFEAKKKIELMRSNGHKIGLHIYISNIEKDDYLALRNSIELQINMFEQFFGFSPCAVSFHRPPLWVLKLYRDDYILGVLNLYGKSFFEILDDDANPKSIKYVADSKHKWSYGDPFDAIGKYKRIQLLLHPDEWSDLGGAAIENFNQLICQNNINFLETLNSECNHFKEYNDYFIRKEK